VTEIFRRRNTRADARKTEGEADHVVTDTTGDLIAQIKLVYEQRISNVEQELERVTATLSKRTSELVSVMHDMGVMRISLEAQSISIARLLAERVAQDAKICSLEIAVELWKSRVIELLGVIRYGNPLPEWVKEIPRE